MFLNRVLKKSWYPRIPQIATLIVFAYVMFSLLMGSAVEADNPGAIMVWLLWWPLIPLTFILLGRFWCVICPFGTIGDWVRTRFGLNLTVPAVIKNNGLWIINALFLIVSWYDVSYGLTKSVSATAVLLILVLAAAIVFSLFYERRAWCRYLCPLGGIFGNYSQTAAIELRGNPKSCKNCRDIHCFNGRDTIPGCSLFISVKNHDSNRTCNLCGDCLKSCLNGSPRVVRRKSPGHELWRKNKPRLDEAVLAASLIGLIGVSTMGMLEIWPPLLNIVKSALPLSGAAAATALMLFVVLLAISTYGAGAYAAARIAGESFRHNFSRFGYGLIPLNLAVHIAHNLNHFLGEGKLIGKALAMIFAPVGPAEAAEKAAALGHGAGAGLVSDPYIQALQFSLVGLGIFLSLGVTRRIVTDNSYKETVGWPHYAVIGLFAFFSFWLFSLPMSPRH